MGNTESINAIFEQHPDGLIPKTNCLICWNSIGPKEWTICNQCNIFLHSDCESRYRGTRGYCKCPHCQGIGTLGSPRYN